MKQCSQNGLVYFQFEGLEGNGRTQHAVFSRQGGVSGAPFASLNLSVSVADNPANVFANRQQAYGLVGRTNETAVHAHLVHGNSVVRVTQANNGEYAPRVDGLITNEPGCALTMNYADCTPIFLYDPAHEAIGLGHAGWKGAVYDLPGAMVRAMQRDFGSNPADCWAGIGPCICLAQYEVDEPLVSEVKVAFDDWPDLLVRPNGKKNGRYHFNLEEANRRNLLNAGVQNIELSGFCTAVRTDLFFSHRGEKGKTGRFGTIFVLDG
ncbi:MAG: peptidoglycan editing factor PgeF [Chloroflexi bacterium]|nr:peptidoglycan editing factor PgeF [Chloroflexota bacterium]